MCDGYSWVYAAIAIAGALEGNRQVRNANETSRQAAANELEQRQADVRAAAQQVEDMQTTQLSERAMETQRELAFLQAAAGEYGGGNTANRLMTIADVAGSRDAATIQNNANKELVQLSRASTADLLTYRSRLDQLRANAPSRTGTLLQIGGAVANGYGNYLSRQPPKTARVGT